MTNSGTNAARGEAGDASIFAVVPAAGRSRRMGADKQMLPIGGRPMLIGVLESLCAADISGVIVVTRGAIVEQIGNAIPPRVQVVLNEDPDAEMIDSIRMGLDAWGGAHSTRRSASNACNGFLFCPGDHPGIRTDDFDTCIAAFRESPKRIVIATHSGRRGHPMIVPADLLDFVYSHECDEGLNALRGVHGDRVRLVECGSPGVIRDIDTPADYDDRSAGT